VTKLKAIDLCCGAGGWMVAARGLPIEFVVAADLAADCLETVQLNHEAEHPRCVLIQADLSTPAGMREVLKAAKSAGGIDLVLGAIPCEEVSVVRSNKPVPPERMAGLHALIDQCFAAVKKLKPRWWCFEDVAVILPHLPAPLFGPVNYEVRKICAADYGPQDRERLYYFGRFPDPAPPLPGPRTLGEILRPGPYRTLRQLQKYTRSRSKWYAGKTLREYAEDEAGPTVTGAPGKSSTNERGFMVPLVRVLDSDQPCPTVADFGSRHERGALVPLDRDRRRLNDREAPSRTIVDAKQGDGQQLVPVERDPFGRERPQDGAEPARAVVSGHGDRGAPVEAGGMVRVLEWQEAAALQGFPSDYVFAASWSRTWKLLSQAIPIQVGNAILRAVAEKWEKSHERRWR